MHYTKGGQPGYYPPIKGKGAAVVNQPVKRHRVDGVNQTPSTGIASQICSDFRDMSAADKKKGLFAEINNGRMAMIGALPVHRRIKSCRGASLDSMLRARSRIGSWPGRR